MWSINRNLVWFFFVINLLSSISGQSYSIPEPKFEIIEPKGFRVSIPDRSGIRLFAFHGSFDNILTGVQPGDFVGEVLQPTNGRWAYENKRLMVENGQTIYYWIHVQYENQGYRLLEKSYRFGSPGSGTAEPPERPPTTAPVTPCPRSKSTVQGRTVCEGELIFEDNFNIFNTSIWKSEVRIPLDVDDADFVQYEDRSENRYITNGVLYIEAMRLDEVPGYNEGKIRNGMIDLGTRCTGIVDTDRECKRNAQLFRILPPVMSARMNTKNSFAFRYGKIEVRAKLPKGDWIFPLITLDPAASDYGITGYASGQMRVAFIRGNEALRTREGQSINGSHLLGGVVLKSGAAERDKWMRIAAGSEHWGNDFHTYSLTWTDRSISLAYDGNTYAEITGRFDRTTGSQMAPFDKEFFITLGLSAGGISDFPDESQSDTYSKPWRNAEPKAELSFWNSRNKWSPSWGNNNARLAVDYVKVWAL